MPNETTTVFCAREQKESQHRLNIDGNGEVVLACVSNVGTEDEPVECGRFVKYPAGTTAQQLAEELAAHRAANEGKLLAENIEKEEAELVNALNNTPPSEPGIPTPDGPESPFDGVEN